MVFLVKYNFFYVQQEQRLPPEKDFQDHKIFPPIKMESVFGNAGEKKRLIMRIFYK
jgi:hypothetical protein